MPDYSSPLNIKTLMNILRILLLIAVSTYLLSCGTQRKAAPFYLQEVNDTTSNAGVIMPELRIQKNDLLSIQVYSLSNDPRADAFFNLPGMAALSSGSSGTLGSSPSGGGAGGFLVDANGDIEFPRLGIIHAEGLTKTQLSIEVKRRLTEPVVLLTSPSVIIRFLNYKITVLGQVGREGVITVPGEKLTLLEAIGLAGGITDYGKKDKVKVMRETDGKREVGYVDLSSEKLFESPFYTLVQNDVVIVEPTKRKQKMADETYTTNRITFALGLISSAAFIATIFLR